MKVHDEPPYEREGLWQHHDGEEGRAGIRRPRIWSSLRAARAKHNIPRLVSDIKNAEFIEDSANGEGTEICSHFRSH